MSKEDHFISPGHYRIEIKGYIRPEWCGRLGGMRVCSPPEQANREMTILQGLLSDQAQLIGILNTLYGMHFPIVSVTYLDDAPASLD